MSKSIAGVGLLSVAIALVATPFEPVLTQGSPDASRRSVAARSAVSWSVPRTPWGDPDLQGVFSNTNEYMTPLERPDAFAGRRLEDLARGGRAYPCLRGARDDCRSTRRPRPRAG